MATPPPSDPYQNLPTPSYTNTPQDYQAMRDLAALGGDFAKLATAVRASTKQMEDSTKARTEADEAIRELNVVREEVKSLREEEKNNREKSAELEKKHAKLLADGNTAAAAAAKSNAEEFKKRADEAKAERDQRVRKYAELKREADLAKKNAEAKEEEIRKVKELAARLKAAGVHIAEVDRVMVGLTRNEQKFNEVRKVALQNEQTAEKLRDQTNRQRKFELAQSQIATSEAANNATNRKMRRAQAVTLKDKASEIIGEMASGGERITGLSTIIESAKRPGEIIEMIRANMNLSLEQLDEVRQTLLESFVSGKVDADKAKRLKDMGLDVSVEKGALYIKAEGVVDEAIDTLSTELKETFDSKKGDLIKDLVDSIRKESPGISYEDAYAAAIASKEYQIKMAQFAKEDAEIRNSIETPAFRRLTEYLPYLNPKEAMTAERLMEEGIGIPKWASKMIGAYERSFGEFSKNFDQLMKTGGESTVLTKMLVYGLGSVSFMLGTITAGVNSLVSIFNVVAGGIAKTIGLKYLPLHRQKLIRRARIGLKRMGFLRRGVPTKISGFGFQRMIAGMVAVLNRIPLLGRFFGFVPKVLGSMGMFFRLGQVLFPPLFAAIQIITAIVGAFRGYGKDGIKGAVIGAISQLISGFTFGFLKFDSVYKFLTQTIGGVVENIIQFATTVYDLLIVPIFDLAKAINSILGGEGGFFQKLIQIVIVLLETLIKQIIGLVGIVIKFLVVDVVKGVFKFFTNTLPKAFNEFLDWLAGAGTSGSIEKFFGAISETFGDAIHNIVIYFLKMMYDFLGDTKFRFIFGDEGVEKIERAKLREKRQKQQEAYDALSEEDKQKYESAKALEDYYKRIGIDPSLYNMPPEVSPPPQMTEAEETKAVQQASQRLKDAALYSREEQDRRHRSMYSDSSPIASQLNPYGAAYEILKKDLGIGPGMGGADEDAIRNAALLLAPYMKRTMRPGTYPYGGYEADPDMRRDLAHMLSESIKDRRINQKNTNDFLSQMQRERPDIMYPPTTGTHITNFFGAHGRTEITHDVPGLNPVP